MGSFVHCTCHPPPLPPIKKHKKKHNNNNNNIQKTKQNTRLIRFFPKWTSWLLSPACVINQFYDRKSSCCHYLFYHVLFMIWPRNTYSEPHYYIVQRVQVTQHTERMFHAEIDR